MKKLAIVGSSNAILKNGFGSLLKNRLGKNCDIFALGSSTSLINNYLILTKNIVNNYKYVIFQFNPIDTLFFEYNLITREYLISILVALIGLFKSSSSIPIFLILPANFIPIHSSLSYIPRSIANIFNIPLIDVEAKCHNYINKPNDDLLHYSNQIQFYISESIHEYINNVKVFEIKFPELFPNITVVREELKYLLQTINVGTSKYNADVFCLSESKRLYLSSDRYLIGLLYWLSDATQCIYYNSSSINIKKSLSLGGSSNIFLIRPIGCNIHSGLKGGYIESTAVDTNYIYEPSWPMEINESCVSLQNSIYLHSIIYSDVNLYNWGQNFYLNNYSIFVEHKVSNIFMKSLCPHLYYDKLSILDQYLPESSKIFSEILNNRQDIINTYLNSSDRIETLFLWAWLHGVNEYPELYKIKDNILNALKIMSKRCAYITISNEYSLLIDCIYRMRKDISNYNPLDPFDRSQIIMWFKNNGIIEFNLEKIF